ncbi:tRNA (guanosine(37)-N1)-methyltransferase TrmD [Stratiformator vulcanicus]|uniref:tRNA (guanine-N(1)-)-methyltransferase n=1 Tax=Stratiformator vulcanicus TaxID=2527980 RepID=A0A517R0D0_9PLAN|nr:tRNA (guanosine(37)-N1)-methyltransferase TrmD [Stratiformator vulcanicus]QDT37355.1 tRNA (guanine-N(1)-)-methyltransferase [Stratiformator vulcanicus]
MRFDVCTLFPEMFESYLGQSILKRAIDRELVSVHRWDFRDYTDDKHNKVDDRPFGGGPGMLIRCQPVFDCVEAVRQVDDENDEPDELISLTPQGERLDQQLAAELATRKRVILLCGRYEGFDERIRLGLKPREVSIGDFVLNGGEVAAMVVIDSVVRLLPGVLGDETSSKYDSFSESGLLEYPQYTRPREYRGMTVPEVLIGGNHEEVARWRAEQSLQRTKERRADLIQQQSQDDAG